MNAKQLIFAREYRGFTQTELANNIQGLSQSNLSKFEKGFDILSDDIQNKIISFLNFPKLFFDKKINVYLDNSNYRKKAGTKKKEIASFEKKCLLIGYVVDELSDTIDWVDYSLQSINVDDGFPVSYIADYSRRMLKITEDEPIKDIITALENAGIIIHEIEAIGGFDGISFFTSKGYPVIIINRYMSNDRKRFTLAHELGHLVMHNENEFPISELRDKEKEANEFASQFLMPEKHIKNALRGMRISDLSPLKRYWLTSKSSIIKRASDLKCIDKQKYIYFNIELSRSGEKKIEKEVVPIDQAQHLKNAYKMLKEELNYSDEDFSEYLTLPKDIIHYIFNDIPKLQIIK